MVQTPILGQEFSLVYLCTMCVVKSTIGRVVEPTLMKCARDSYTRCVFLKGITGPSELTFVRCQARTLSSDVPPLDTSTGVG